MKPSLWPDTHPDSERILLEGYRRMSPARKLQQVVALTQGCQQLALARLRAQYPGEQERRLQLRLAALWIDDETMRNAFGWDPESEGR